jgi:hypothetical protein
MGAKKRGGKKKNQKSSPRKIVEKAKKILTKVLQGAAARAMKGAVQASAKLAGVNHSSE